MDRPNAFNPEKNQDSQGGLKDSQNVQTASSQSVIAELDVDKIDSFQQIPDYTSQTIAPVPIVVISPTSCSCIDGWDLIRGAKSAGCSTIACYAFYIPKHCEIEIAIRKVAIRTMPQAGTCSYAELVRNAGILFKMLIASAENPILFSHGGSRRGVDYTENQENNIRKLLANRLGKSVTTISKYLNHGEFLNAEAIDALVNVGIDKGFFEEAQPYKRKIIDDLKSTKKTEIEITTSVSEAMLVLLKAYLGNKSQSISVNYDDRSANHPAQNGDSSPPAATSRDLESRSSSKPQKIFRHWTGSDHQDEDHQPTENDVRREIKSVGSELIEMSDSVDLTSQQIAEIVSSQIVRLAKLVQHLKGLEDLNTENTEDKNNG